MADRLDLYDVLGTLVPGLLLLIVVPQLFPDLVQRIGVPSYPDAFTVIAMTAVAIFIGHTMQALGSLVEPILYWTWGGRPSEVALEAGLGDRYLPKDTAVRVRGKLRQAAGDGATVRSLFLYAAQRAEGAAGRVVSTLSTPTIVVSSCSG